MEAIFKVRFNGFLCFLATNLLIISTACTPPSISGGQTPSGSSTPPSRNQILSPLDNSSTSPSGNQILLPSGNNPGSPANGNQILLPSGVIQPLPNSGFSIKSAVVLTPAKQIVGRGSQAKTEPLPAFHLPSNIDIRQVKIVKASLDGKDISPEQLQLSKDKLGNIVFLMRKDAFKNEFTGENRTPAKNIYTSKIFQQKKDAMRTRLLKQLKGKGATGTVNQKLPKPAFLKNQLNGTPLTLNKVATLKKAAGQLAKEGVFLDRNFYVMLEVQGQTFKVQQNTPQKWVTKFDIKGKQVKTLKEALNNSAKENKALKLPLIVEKPTQNDDDFFADVSDIKAAQRLIEIEEIEESLELELGSEFAIAEGAASFGNFEFDLDLDDLESLETENTELARDAYEDAESSEDELDTLLNEAENEEQEIKNAFGEEGLEYFDDESLFDETLGEADEFEDFDEEDEFDEYDDDPNLPPDESPVPADDPNLPPDESPVPADDPNLPPDEPF